MWEWWASSPYAAAAVAAGAAVLAALAVFVLKTSVYKHIVCLKYLFGGWKAVVPLVAAQPAALGVFLLILVFAIMDGFARETREMTRGTLADVIVDAHMEGLPHYDEFIERIRALEGVEAATPVIQTYAVARIRPRFVGVKPLVRPCLLLGVRPGEKAAMGRFREYLQRQGGSVPAEDLLAPLPPAEPGGPPRAACIAGVGLIGAPMADQRTEVIDLSPIVIAAWSATGAVWLVFALVLYGSLRRHARGTSGWWLAGLGVLVVAGAALVEAGGRAAWETVRAVALGEPWPAGAWAMWLGAAVWGAEVAVVAVLLFRRHERRAVWGRPAAALVVLLALAASLTVHTAGLRYGPQEMTRSEVVDVPLLEYGADLVVSTIPIRPSGALEVEAGGVPRVASRALGLVDRFKSGYWDADSSHLYVDFALAQQMAGMDGQPAQAGRPAVPARASQVHVKLRDPARAEAVIERIRRAWEALAGERGDDVVHLTVNTWETQQRLILTVVKVERNITALMLGLMFLGFGVLIGLISYVMAYIKSRDVGILKALGARDAGVGSLFLGYGFLIGLLGTAAGLAAALLMLHYLDPIEIWVNNTLGIDVFPREMYYFERIPRNISALWCAAVAVSVLALSTLASTVGGLRAALKQPVETLRYE